MVGSVARTATPRLAAPKAPQPIEAAPECLKSWGSSVAPAMLAPKAPIGPTRQADHGLEPGVRLLAEQFEDMTARDVGPLRPLLARDPALEPDLLEQIEHIFGAVAPRAADLAVGQRELREEHDQRAPPIVLQLPPGDRIDIEDLSLHHPSDVLGQRPELFPTFHSTPPDNTRIGAREALWSRPSPIQIRPSMLLPRANARIEARNARQSAFRAKLAFAEAPVVDFG